MINWIVSSGVLILIVIGMRYFLKGKISAKLQYALWILVAIRLLIPVSFGNSMLSIENITTQILPNTEDTLVQDAAQENRFADEDIDEVIYQDQAANIGVAGSDVNEETTYVPREDNTSYVNVWFWIWLIGVGSTTGVFLATNIVFQRKVKKSRNAIYVNWCRHPVYVSEEVETPCLLGVFSPIIYVTEEVAQNTLLLRHTVMHEEMHYKQGDSLWALIRCACLALHWYNPLVWWAAILSKKDAEFSCDEATIKTLGEDERKEYGKTLIQLSSKEKYNVFLTATAMTSGKKSIKERIVFIAKKPKAKWYTLVVCVLISAAAVGCTFTQGEKQNNDVNSENEAGNIVTENSDQQSISNIQISEPDYWMKPDKNKVCLAVMPDGVSQAGGDYRYIIPEDQTKWMDGYKQMRSLASGNGKWKEDERSMGVWIVYGEEWTCITDQGFIFDFEKRIEKSEAEEFYNICMQEAYKNGTGEPVRPEDIGALTCVTIQAEGYGDIVITDDYILDEIQKTFNLSTEIRGGSACPFTTSIILESENGKKKHIVYLASDSCSAWLSDGVYYEDSYGIIEELKDMLEAQKIVYEFSQAYFANDGEALKGLILPTSSVEVTGYEEGETVPIFNKINGLEGCVHNYKTLVSVEVRLSEDADYFVYLEMPIRKQEGEWKVESYWLEQ